MSKSQNKDKPSSQPLAMPSWGLPLGLAAALGIIASAFLDQDPSRFYANTLLWFLVLLSIALGCIFLIALEHLVAAQWSVPLRRIPERIAVLLVPLFPVGLVLGLLTGRLYPWAMPSAVNDPIVQAKAAWLNQPFFIARIIASFLLWLLFYYLLVKGSLKQDQKQDGGFSKRAKPLSTAFMIIFALSVSIAAFDWIMSLEPHWFSSIIGVYLFAGVVICGLASVTVISILLRRRGRLTAVRSDHMYNLGALLFAFNAFWAYIAFSQFMLIWYANLPEETPFFLQRFQGSWVWLSAALPLLHFLIPFFALLARDAKCSEKRLLWVAVWLLACHALDMYWYIFPAVSSRVLLGWQELCFALFFTIVPLQCIFSAQSIGADMPEGDPDLKQGLAFRLQRL